MGLYNIIYTHLLQVGHLQTCPALLRQWACGLPAQSLATPCSSQIRTQKSHLTHCSANLSIFWICSEDAALSSTLLGDRRFAQDFCSAAIHAEERLNPRPRGAAVHRSWCRRCRHAGSFQAHPWWWHCKETPEAWGFLDSCSRIWRERFWKARQRQTQSVALTIRPKSLPHTVRERKDHTDTVYFYYLSSTSLAMQVMPNCFTLPMCTNLDASIHVLICLHRENTRPTTACHSKDHDGKVLWRLITQVPKYSSAWKSTLGPSPPDQIGGGPELITCFTHESTLCGIWDPLSSSICGDLFRMEQTYRKRSLLFIPTSNIYYIEENKNQPLAWISRRQNFEVSQQSWQTPVDAARNPSWEKLWAPSREHPLVLRVERDFKAGLYAYPKLHYSICDDTSLANVCEWGNWLPLQLTQRPPAPVLHLEVTIPAWFSAQVHMDNMDITESTSEHLGHRTNHASSLETYAEKKHCSSCFENRYLRWGSKNLNCAKHRAKRQNDCVS